MGQIRGKRICNHAKTESTLVLTGKEKRIGDLTLLRQATLIEFCEECEQEFNYYVAGGVIFGVGYDNSRISE